MDENIAKKYWRDFEKFVLEYLKDRFNIIDERFAFLTPPSGDGGYDGVIFSSVNFSYESIREILFEAKLRSALGHSIPLNDFSKALIIAVNRFADEVYIATNIIFSPDTLHQLEVFANRIGIYIETVNGKTLYDWYENQSSDIMNCFDTEFITFLKESSEAISSDFYNTDEETLPEEKNSNYVKDINRSNQIDLIKSHLSNYSGGIAFFTGNRGCGKSCMCTILKEHFEKSSYKIIEIDMYEQNTSRTIFLKFLEGVWGVPSEIIIQSNEKEVAEIFKIIGSEKLTQHDIRGLQFVFSKDIKEYNGHSDIYQYLLLNILEKLSQHYSSRFPFCVHIHNMESAHEESCNFIQKLITRLISCKIYFLIEIRNNYTGEMNISLQDWSAIQHKFRNLPMIIGEYDVSSFSLDEKVLYIKQVIPSLNNFQIKQLAQSVPDNPLILDAALRILKPKLRQDYIIQAEYENELRYFTQNYDSAILKELLRNIISNEVQLIIPFAMLSFLKGKTSIENIAFITGKNPQEIKILLSDTGLIKIDKNCISVKHEFYINTLQDYSVYISKILLQELANKMIDNIEIFYQDALEKNILYVKLLDVCEKYVPLLEVCQKTGKALYQQGDNKTALDIYMKGYNLFDSKFLEGPKFTLQKLDILKNIIFIKWNTVGGNDNELNNLLSKFHLLIRTSRKYFQHHIKYIESCVYEILFKMKELHLKSEHKECLKHAHRAKRLARKYNGQLYFPTALEQVLWIKSLCIKHLYGIEACIDSFESDLRKNSDFPLLQFSYNTHKAATLSGLQPKLALLKFQKNEKYYLDLSMSEQLHNRVNIANMKFYLKEYDKAKEIAESIVMDAFTYNVKIELGRTYNILGNYYFVMGSMESSVEFYKKSIDIFEKLEHSIHLWPPLINCAYVCIFQNNYEEALNLLKKALPIFLKRSGELVNTIGRELSRTNKLLVGVIIALHLFWIIAEHFQEAIKMYDLLLHETRMYLPENINNICSDNVSFAQYFKDSVYEYSGKIVLKL